MPLSRELRLLQNKWNTNTHWPKRLEWIEIYGIRGWSGFRIEFKFPMMAISGENGSGKSTILQAAASIYAPDPSHPAHESSYASDYFPDTFWDHANNAMIRYSVRQGSDVMAPNSVRKPGTRWRGNPNRPRRAVEFADLSRIQPVSARVGYSRLAKSNVREVSCNAFEEVRTQRLSEIMGKRYGGAKMAVTDLDPNRVVPVVSVEGREISGFHLGAGELTMAEFLKIDPPPYSLLLIDEIETSLHPRAQRRLIRDLANLCRTRELQIIFTTHSPYVLSELPQEGRAYILTNDAQKEIVLGVSPEFAMTKMDEEQHPECDLYVEDDRAGVMLREVLVKLAPQLVSRIQIVPYGAASVGKSLGIMVSQNRFPRRSVVFLDGDQSEQPGCQLLPGNDAPERVVFGSLSSGNWHELHKRIGRTFSDVADHCSRAMTADNHHEWVSAAATPLLLSSDVLWQAMCAEWAQHGLAAVAHTWQNAINAIADSFGTD